MVHELLGHTAAVQSSSFSSDSQFVATCSWDQSVRVWKLRDGKEVTILQGHLGNVACLSFSVTGMQGHKDSAYGCVHSRWTASHQRL
ncbi:WD repeat-containing protein 38 [Myxocyprinus asiaticus]|uniref:WD repeat-containing protein 38 n=1 Tax=Myxocyprinus asiaticus TaxID=70543 RepID=UPI002222ABC6|nr:WD repeat-containing protein 38 [Myxocyprinus asiaticus]